MSTSVALKGSVDDEHLDELDKDGENDSLSGETIRVDIVRRDADLSLDRRGQGRSSRKSKRENTLTSRRREGDHCERRKGHDGEISRQVIEGL